MALYEVRAPPFYRGNWQGDLLIIYFCLQPKLKTKMLQPHPAPEDRVVMSPRGSDPAPRIQGAAVDPDFMADRPQMQWEWQITTTTSTTTTTTTTNHHFFCYCQPIQAK